MIGSVGMQLKEACRKWGVTRVVLSTVVCIWRLVALWDNVWISRCLFYLWLVQHITCLRTCGQHDTQTHWWLQEPNVWQCICNKQNAKKKTNNRSDRFMKQPLTYQCPCLLDNKRLCRVGLKAFGFTDLSGELDFLDHILLSHCCVKRLGAVFGLRNLAIHQRKLSTYP